VNQIGDGIAEFYQPITNSTISKDYPVLQSVPVVIGLSLLLPLCLIVTITLIGSLILQKGDQHSKWKLKKWMIAD
jgi:hypothetical protein